MYGAERSATWGRCRTALISSELPQAVRDIVWRGQLRMCQRYRHLVAAGKAKVVVITAITCEMAGFIWAIARTISPAKA